MQRSPNAASLHTPYRAVSAARRCPKQASPRATMPRRAAGDDEIEEQPIALRSLIKAGHIPSPRLRFRRHHVMASRNEGLQLESDKAAADCPSNNEAVTPTPRAAKFSGFPGDSGGTPTSVGSALTPDAAASAQETQVDALVEIKVRRRKPTEVERQAAVQAASAFDDTPPAEVYDPAWNTLPFRCEAGQLRHGKNTTAKAPVLPGAFRMNPEHEDEDEEETGTVARQRADKENEGGQSKAKAVSPKKGSEGITERQRAALGRLFVKRKGGKDGGSPSSGSSPRIELKLKKANRNTIESNREAKAALHHLSVILQCDYQAEIVAHKSSELRVKVPIKVGGEMQPHTVVIGASALADKSGSKMTFRRSLTDISRISQEEFFTFCEDVNKRFKKLEGAIKNKGRK